MTFRSLTIAFAFTGLILDNAAGQIPIVVPDETGDPALVAQMKAMLQAVQITTPEPVDEYESATPIKLDLALPASNATVTQIIDRAINLQVSLAGSIGTITGLLPVSTEIAPTIVVAWSVRDENGIPVAEDRLEMPNGAAVPSLTLRIVPPIEELTTSIKPAHYTVRARVRLKLGTDPCIAGATCTAFRTIEHKIAITKIGIPTAVVFFSRQNFRGAPLMVVPTSSPIRSRRDLLKVLEGVQATLTTLRTVAKFQPLLPSLKGLEDVSKIANRLLGAADFKLRRANTINHFTEIPMRERDYGPVTDDTDADNFFEALLFIGTTRKLACYSEPNTNRSEARFSVSTPSDLSSVTVLVPNLSKDPASDPKNRVKVHDHDPSGNFRNELSSMRFYF